MFHSLPYRLFQTRVPDSWIDVNGHMNATHYFLSIYEAHAKLADAINFGSDYVAQTNCGKAVLESHLIYEREIALNDEIAINSWILAVDPKRIHFFHEIINLTRGERAAAGEQVDIHIDLAARGSSEMPQELFDSLKDIVRRTLLLPLPEGIGRCVRPPRNSWLEQE